MTKRVRMSENAGTLVKGQVVQMGNKDAKWYVEVWGIAEYLDEPNPIPFAKLSVEALEGEIKKAQAKSDFELARSLKFLVIRKKENLGTGMSMTEISLQEVFKVFLPENRGRIYVCRTFDETVVMRLSWKQGGLPFNQQYIWLLYNIDSQNVYRVFAELERIIDDLSKWRGTVLISDYQPNLITDILLLSDGGIFRKICRFEFPTSAQRGREVHKLGIVVGQGRTLNQKENSAIVNVLWMAMAEYLAAQGIKNKFVESGMKILEGTKEYFKEKCREAVLLHNKEF